MKTKLNAYGLPTLEVRSLECPWGTLPYLIVRSGRRKFCCYRLTNFHYLEVATTPGDSVERIEQDLLGKHADWLQSLRRDAKEQIFKPFSMQKKPARESIYMEASEFPIRLDVARSEGRCSFNMSKEHRFEMALTPSGKMDYVLSYEIKVPFYVTKEDVIQRFSMSGSLKLAEDVYRTEKEMLNRAMPPQDGNKKSASPKPKRPAKPKPARIKLEENDPIRVCWRRLKEMLNDGLDAVCSPISPEKCDDFISYCLDEVRYFEDMWRKRGGVLPISKKCGGGFRDVINAMQEVLDSEKRFEVGSLFMLYGVWGECGEPTELVTTNLHEIELHGRRIAYKVRVQKSRKRLIAYSSNPLEVRSPAGVSLERIEEFLQSIADWVLKHASQESASSASDDDTGGKGNEDDNGADGLVENGLNIIELKGQRVPYAMRFNRRRKRIAIVAKDPLEVRCPPCATRRDAEAFLREQADWVLARLPKGGPVRDRYRDGGEIPYRGGRAVLVLGQEQSIVVQMSDRTEIWLDVPKDAAPEKVKARLTALLKKYAWRVINDCWMRVMVAAPKLPASWRLSSARTRWGCCTARDTIRLSWRLIARPDDEIEYVIAHELAHLKEFNHSSRFWTEVGRILPGWETAHERMKTLRAEEKLTDL